MSIFNYVFMQKALYVSVILGILLPLLGTVVVLKRQASSPEAMGHSSLVGVSIGLILGYNPVWISVIVCIVFACLIEILSGYIKRYKEMATMIILSLGIGLAAVLSSFVKNGASFNSYLFGSIVAIDDSEIILVTLIFGLVFSVFLCFYHQICYIIIDEKGALLDGINLKFIKFIVNLLVALVVAISARIVGTLIVSSMMVIPVACAMQLANSYRKLVILSCSFSVLYMLCGLIISYYFDLKPGGTMVLLSIIGLLSILVINKIFYVIGRIKDVSE